MFGLAMMAALALFVGCASRGPGGPHDAEETVSAAAGRECVIGVIEPEGVPLAPRTWIRPEEGPRVELVGELVGNVRLLSRTTVRVCGPGRTESGALQVTEVSMVAAEGMPARLGTLRAAGAEWVLEPLFEGELAVLVAEVPADLAEVAGSVVWVAGPVEDGRVAVRSYGVLEGWR